MAWKRVGPDGAHFKAEAAASPGWYWVYRPLSVGDRVYDPGKAILLPVVVYADGRVDSPLADLDSLDQAVCIDAERDLAYESWFAGPLAPGPLSGRLSARPGHAVEGAAPSGPGWLWCRTEAPLLHVDSDGIGPIFLQDDDLGRTWVYPAATVGAAMDVFELGFAEPLVSAGGIIDSTGDVGRHTAEFFGVIEHPRPLPSSFPTSPATSP